MNILIISHRNYRITFDDGKVIEKKALFVALANSNQFGYNTTIAPNAKIKDGLLDVCIVEKPKIYRLLLIANLMLLKMVDVSPSVQIVKSKSLKIIRGNKGIVNIDGEAISSSEELDIKVNPLSLKIIINQNVSKV